MLLTSDNIWSVREREESSLTWLKRLLRGRCGRLPVVPAASCVATTAAAAAASVGMVLNGRHDKVILQDHRLVDGRPVRHDRRRRWHGPDLNGRQGSGDRQGLLRVAPSGRRSPIALPYSQRVPAGRTSAATATATHLEHHLHVVRRTPAADPPMQIILGRSGCGSERARKREGEREGRVSVMVGW